MPEKAWAYYSSAADDEITNRENHAAYHRYAEPVYCIIYSILTIPFASKHLVPAAHPEGHDQSRLVNPYSWPSVFHAGLHRAFTGR
jgi:hypothetical protein